MNSPGITIRDLRIEDYKDLIALWEKAGLPSRPRGRDSREEIRRQLAQPMVLYLAAEVDGQLVGAVLGTHDGRKGWINRLAVAPTHRRLGIGRRLVAEVEQRLEEQGIQIIACLIEDWNEASLEVFERLGYERHRDIYYLSKRRHLDV